MKISVSILGKKIESTIPNKRDGIVTSMEWFCLKCGKKMKVSLYKDTTKTD
jgi:RNase P subunit RPR2